MEPFVELSFMPSTPATGHVTVFHYRANVTPPKDYGHCATLISRVAPHLVQRYGIDEVCRWLFEVWHEPNLPAF
jgi:xylan 1,4-beta-xylosidase